MFTNSLTKVVQKLHKHTQLTQKLTPIPKNVIVTKTFAPKFCAEWSDQEIHSSHGDYFRDHFITPPWQQLRAWGVTPCPSCFLAGGDPISLKIGGYPMGASMR